MARSVARTAARAGLPEPEVGALLRAHDLAMGRRGGRIDDEHDPRYLHPGRTVLVLLHDAGVRDAAALAAAALVESEFAALEVAREDVAAALGHGLAALRESVPVPRRAGEALAERLVVADRRVRLIALAERLDQLRHAHLWPEMERRRSAHAAAAEIYLPIAERTDQTLARRYRWWCGMFARRFLRAP